MSTKKKTTKKKPVKKRTSYSPNPTPESVWAFIQELSLKEAERAAETDRRIKALTQEIGGIGKTNGEIAEEFFYDTLNENLSLGKMSFSALSRNIKLKDTRGELKGELDMLLTNGDTAAIVEVKQKASEEDVKQLLTKIKPFRAAFPAFKKYKIYLALAAFIIPKNVFELAKKEGIAILKKKGKLIESTTHKLKFY